MRALIGRGGAFWRNMRLAVGCQLPQCSFLKVFESAKWERCGKKQEQQQVGMVVGSQIVRCGYSTGHGDGESRRFSLIDFRAKRITVFRMKETCAKTNGSTHGFTHDDEHLNPRSKMCFKEGYNLTDPCLVDSNTSSELESSSENVLHRLKQGFIRFKQERFLKEPELFQKLATGQQPKVMVIACCDSRVCPTMIMGCEPGEVFAVRNVANLVPPFEKEGRYHGTSAALEFAVTGLKLEHIIVLGHRACGGINALMSRSASDLESDFISSWMSVVLPAKQRTQEVMANEPFSEQCRYCEKEAINVSLGNLLTFPWIAEKFNEGSLSLHGWYYDFVEGSMTSWEVQPSSLTKYPTEILAAVGH